MAFRVVAPAVQFERSSSKSGVRDTFYQGSLLPDDASAGWVAYLVSLGMVAEVGDTPTPADPGQQPVSSDLAAQLADLKAANATAMAAADQAASAAQQAQAATAAQSSELASLAQVAATAQQAIATSSTDRTSIRQWLARLQAEVDTWEATPGPAGRSAYELWLDAGNTGTPANFLASLRGPRGDDGHDASNAQVASAVAAYMAANPPPAGINGKSVELRVSGGAIEWRQTGGTWASLTPLSALTGAPGTNGTNGTDGRSVELQKSATAVQWRPTGGTWADLVPLSAITGTPGAAGANATDAQVASVVATYMAANPPSTAKLRQATKPLPALAIGATDVPVTWDVPMPTATYTVYPSITGSSTTVGKLFPQVKTGTLTTTGCTITVSSIVALTLGSATLSVLAFSPT